MVAAAIVGAGVVTAVGTTVAASNAASAQEHAANQAIAAQQGYFNTAAQAENPFILAGQNAIPEISQLEGIPYYDANGNLVQPTPGQMQQTLSQMPGYQFSNYQGLKSVQNSATARGLGISGAAQKAAANYSTGLANQYYNNLLTGLQSTENTGASGASSLAGAAVQTGANVGQNITGAANANAAAQLATANALSGAANSLPTALLSNSLMKSLYGNGNDNLGGASTPFGANAANYAQLQDSGVYNAGTFDVGAAQGGLPWSDVSLKENIKLVGVENGHNIYEFNYFWSPIKYIGVMAQEVQKKNPEAVVNVDGYLAVDYDKLGIEFRAAA